MSKIDWTKPLRITNSPKLSVSVVREDMGRYHVTWTTVLGRADAFVNKDGDLIATLHSGASNTLGFVENAPEEPKDTLAIWTPARPGWTDGYSIDSVNGQQLQTKNYWEKQLGKNPQGIIFVKVPA